MMSTEIQDRDTIVHRAVEIPSAEARAAYLGEACGDDASLRRQVEEKVAAHFRDGNRAVAAARAATAPHPDGQQSPGTCIGPYKLVKQIGEGGMGIVYLAEQQQPVQRQVALKIIKDGPDAHQVIARLEAEQQALARLNHPTIARVLDVGITPTGRPYVVTELAKGSPITVYCNEQRLTLRQRLELFVPVCRAVLYAHQKGIMHGGLKPTNVLVANVNGQVALTVLDFGIATATLQQLSERTLSGGPGGLVGTLEYLSPEQAGANAQDIDTRSDIYSLGALLYDLVTGTTPLTRQRLMEAEMSEALRLVREEETLYPSARLSVSKDLLVSVALERHVDPSVMIDNLRGELDCLVMKALHKDRDQRYETVHALQRDIERHLADEPVEACQPSPRARLWKWARKSPRLLAASVGLLLLLAVAAVWGASVGTLSARAEKQERALAAEAKAERDKAKQAATDAENRWHEAATSLGTTTAALGEALEEKAAKEHVVKETRAVQQFLRDKLLSRGRTEEKGGLGKDVTLRQALDAAEKKVAKEYTFQPLAEAAIRDTLGSAYQDLGEHGKAVKQYERAFFLLKSKLGERNKETRDCMNKLEVAYRLNNQKDAADSLAKQSPETPALAEELAVQGRALLAAKKPAEAAAKLRECLNIRQRIQSDDWLTFDTRSLLGEALLQQQKYAEAEPLLLSGYMGMEQRQDKMPQQAKDHITKALERLVQLYDARDKEQQDKAAKWRKQLAAKHSAK